MVESAPRGAVTLRLLGPPELHDGREPRVLARRKAMALLAYLALEERTHARDSLAALFWPECDQVRARGNLRSSLFELGRALGTGVIDSLQDRVQFAQGNLNIDVHDLLDGTRPCGHDSEAMPCPACLDRMGMAVRSWGGAFMEGFTLVGCPDFDDWQFRWSTRLREALVSLLRRLLPAYRREGRLDEAAALAERWIESEPYVEEARRIQLELLLEMGMVARARDCFEAWKRTAQDELGREPSPGLRGLVDSAGNQAGTPHPSFPTSPGAQETRSGLVGRKDDIEALQAELRGSSIRLHSLTGTGGIGKTAIARALLQEEEGSFPGGAIFLDLSAERDASRIPFRLASAFGMRELGDSPEAMTELLVGRLGQTKTLLVADNLEQLPGAAVWLAPLLESCRGLVIVVTSRRELGIAGESVHLIKPLAFPQDGEAVTLEEVPAWPALDLFIRRARRADPLFEPEGRSLASCVRLCARLDGIPLALELGASLMALLGPEELLSRQDRQHLLSTPYKGERPSRHSSLASVLDWSHELLGPCHQRLYAALAVFLGDFDLEAVEAVLGDPGLLGEGLGADADPEETSILAGIEILIGASLLRRHEEAGASRFSFFQTIHDHASALFKRLPHGELIRDRCAAYYLDRAVGAEVEVRGPEQVCLLHRLEADQANFEASLERFAKTGRAEEARRLCSALEWPWFRSGRFASGIRCLERALSLDSGNTELPDPAGVSRGACLRALGWLRFTQGAWHEAHARYLEALVLLEAAGDRRETTRCLSDLGVVERWLGNRVGGDLRSSRAIELARILDEPGLLARALVWGYGTTGGKPGNEEQREGLEEAVRLGQLSGEPWILAHAHESLGDLFRARGRTSEALPHFERALKGFTQLEDGWMLAWTLEGYGMNDCAEGRQEAGRQRFREALGLFLGLGARGDAAFVLGELALATALAGDREEGDFLLGVFAAIRGELGLRTLAQTLESPAGGPGLREVLDLAAARGAAEWRKGLSMGYEDLPRILA
ncbi:MAG: BTAD domain-containing putative transcriptional regulator [Spirochaetota bacterium]